jgi:glycosyltransferase involved in cell wall biosynthesis
MHAPANDEPWIEDLPAPRRSLRIAMVTETYPPEVNGVAMSMARIVEGLHQRNHQVQLVRPRQREADATRAAPPFDELLTAGWPIPLYPNLRLGAPSKRALVRHWSLHRPDVVHIATEGPLGWSALEAARRLELPVTSDFRTNFHAYGPHYKLGWLAAPIMGYLRKFHNRTHCTMVPTQALRAELALRGFERLEVVSRGVDTQLFDPRRRSTALRQTWGAERDDLVLLCVGRLAAEKNLGLVLAAFEAVRREQPRVRLVLVGDGPLRAELRTRCPYAVLAGQRGGEDLAAHYASADLFLFPSLTETFGNVTTEAMASGLPVVAFRSAAAGQLIEHERNGLIADGIDEASFVQAALHAARQPARRAAWGTAARVSVRTLDWGEVIARFESVLESAIDAPSGRDAAPRPRWMGQAT